MTSLILALLAGIVIGCAGTLLWCKARVASLQTLLTAKENETANLRADFTRTQEELKQLNEENKILAADKQTIGNELSLLRRQTEQNDEQRRKQFEQQLCLVKEQLQNATQQLLKQRAEELSQQNTQQMQAVINPLKENIAQMRAAFDSNRDANNKNAASLEKAIDSVMRHTADIGDKADKLASALRNENKMQGNWGELILDELLQSEGLTEGIHYDKQTTLRDAAGNALLNSDTGNRMIPDVVLHYTDGKDVVIDSKVSLSAFIDYQNAQTPEQRNNALQRHIRSMQQHVAELSRKDYSSYIRPPRQSLNYVIMFVPNEGALQLAQANDPQLWRDALAKGVCITGEQSIMPFLRIIQMAWTQKEQANNQEEIINAGRMLLDRVCDFLKFFETMGQKLRDASDFYSKASEKLSTGRQSVTGAANKLQNLGVKHSPNKKLPPVVGIDE